MIVWIITAWNLLDQAAWRVIEYLMVDLETKTMKELYQHCFDRLHGHSYRFFSNSFTGALVKKVNKLVGSFESLTDMFIFNLSLSPCL
ncbi:MAG: hypothetical protein Q8O99_05380 [bacterium]|nr:hypothetical protein [bacterium]